MIHYIYKFSGLYYYFTIRQHRTCGFSCSVHCCFDWRLAFCPQSAADAAGGSLLPLDLTIEVNRAPSCLPRMDEPRIDLLPDSTIEVNRASGLMNQLLLDEPPPHRVIVAQRALTCRTRHSSRRSVGCIRTRVP